MFQFRFGAIDSSVKDNIQNYKTGFNSGLVRLIDAETGSAV